MQKAKGLELARHYDSLNPEERFRLIIRAMARDDDTEIARLRRSCPTAVYRRSISDYVALVEASRTLAFVISVDLARMLGKVRVLEALSESNPVVGKVHNALLNDLWALWEAFAEVCDQEMGLNPEDVMKAWMRPILEEIARCELVTPDPNNVSKRSALVRQIWLGECGK